MSKRLELLQKMTQSGQADAFAWYGLAMEYRREGRVEEALVTFDKLRALHPDYLPMYLMAAQVRLAEGNKEGARSWLLAGIPLAEQRGDTKTLGELQEALEETE